MIEDLPFVLKVHLTIFVVEYSYRDENVVVFKVEFIVLYASLATLLGRPTPVSYNICLLLRS